MTGLPLTGLPPIPARIEEYGLLSDCVSAALVSQAGSIDWLCWPRFDSSACFAALLGGVDNGRWQICPAEETREVERRYRDGSTVIETVFDTAGGSAAVIDFMPMGRESGGALVRIVEGRSGSVAMQLRLKLRFDYGSIVPWVTQLDEAGQRAIVAIAGPELVVLRGDVATEGRDLETVAEFSVAVGQRVRFVLSHGPSHLPPPEAIDADAALEKTEAVWRAWSGRCAADGAYAKAIERSLITLKALTFAETGGIVAAPTTSLPEQIGGGRNWDYRYCWLRDATLTLLALMNSGFYDEAQAWCEWLHRAIAGAAEQIQIMYGVGGERRLDEWSVSWLSGYEGSAPVRIGNQAAGQVQLDVFGDVIGAFRQARLGGLVLPSEAWTLECNLLGYLEGIWRDPDEGMWEVRGGRRQFTFSKVMAWLAFASAIRDAEDYGLEAPLPRWRAVRDEIHATVCREGVDPERGCFVQSFGSRQLDANLLLIPLTGFLPADDARVVATLAAVERDLLRDGLVRRYQPDEGLDGQDGAEGMFLACSFWLVNNLVLQGRAEEGKALFERLIGLRNDLGLLSEEYDPEGGRLVGNFPQAFSHLAMVTSARILRDGNHPGLLAPAEGLGQDRDNRD